MTKVGGLVCSSMKCSESDDHGDDPGIDWRCGGHIGKGNGGCGSAHGHLAALMRQETVRSRLISGIMQLATSWSQSLGGT